VTPPQDVGLSFSEECFWNVMIVIGKVVPYILKFLLRNDLPNNTVSFPRRLKSSPTPL
jgi:hypothetical protein